VTGASANGSLATLNVAGGNNAGGWLFTQSPASLSRVNVTNNFPGGNGATVNANSADAISRSGRYVVGNYTSGPSAPSVFYRLDRQTQTTTSIAPPNGSFGDVRTISDNGSVMFIDAGSGGAPTPAHAWRWTESSGYQALPTINYTPAQSAMWPNRTERYFPTDATGDGNTAVGYVIQGPSFIWDQTGGTRVLQTELTTRYGLNLTGWNLRYDVWISNDGHWLMGNGDYQASPTSGVTASAWIAYVPTPTATALLGISGLASLRRRR
jgi:hypothetical protein